nr:PREDICTED: uncharacterized protein LOC103369434 [Stegastes partitus]
MAFFRQLRLLLWKNGLAVVRQPLWSLTLIIWPLIIFILIAVTRNRFPPVIRDTCYVGPRNLPSTGVFPFLQTLMCNTDSNCHNKSLLPDPTTTKSAINRRSAFLRNGSPLVNLRGGGDLFNFTFSNDSVALMEKWKNVWGSFHQRRSNNVTLMRVINATGWGDKESLQEMLASDNLLKRAVCTMTLRLTNMTSPGALKSAVVSFCKSNNTVFEVLLGLLDQKLMELMMTDTDEMMKLAGNLMLMVNQLQNKTSLWERLLSIPDLFNAGPLDEKLDVTEALLTELQGAMRVIQSNFPETGDSFTAVKPMLTAVISLSEYAQKWPGKGVYISLGDILKNDSLSEIVKAALKDVQIPLDKAVGLTMDKDMVRSYLCSNTSGSMWLTAACSSGTVNMFLNWICPDKVAKQALLAWSRHVAPHDVAFVKGLLHSVMGGSPSGGSNVTRSRRSTDEQPQNIEEELFLGVGQVVMDLITIVPQADMVVQRILRGGLQSMESGTVAFDTVEDMVSNVLADANQLQAAFRRLLSNQSEASAWATRVMDSAMEVIMKGPEALTCEEVLDPFEWLLSTKSVKIEVFRSMLCPKVNSSLEQDVLMDWMPLVQKVRKVYSAFTSEGDYNATLPMILSEWRKLRNNSLQFGGIWQRLSTGLGGTYWMNWMPDNNTHDVAETLQQSVFRVMVDLGEKIEKTQMWPRVKNYFHMVYWILNYRPGVTTQPANCSIDTSTMAILCDTGLKWPQCFYLVL